MALSAEADYVLRTIEERGIRFIRLWFTDVLGFLKSFTITSQELEGAFTEGMGFDGSSIEGFSRIQESDMIAVPDPATFQLIPWQTEQTVARMFCDIYDPDGTPFDGDPRGVLKRQLQRASDLGFTFYVGPELEFFYFKSVDDPTPLDQGGYFDETPLDVATDYRKRTVLYLESMGIPVEYVHHEVAPSQHEIDLRYSDALTMADNVMTYRLTVKEVAQEFGIYATFMPKPIAGMNGSGMHTHQSLFEGDRNAFFDATDEYHLSKTARAYIAGILRHAPEITLRHEPVGQLVQAADPRVRGAGVRVLGATQPLRAGARPALQAGQGRRDADRVPLARPGLQPVPRVLRHARGRSGRHRGRIRAGARGVEQHLRDDRRGARRRGDPFAARGSARGDPAGRRLHRAPGCARRARPRVPDPQQAPGVGRVQGVRHARTKRTATSRSSRPILSPLRSMTDLRRVDFCAQPPRSSSTHLPGRGQRWSDEGCSLRGGGSRAALLSLIALSVVALGAPPALAIPINSSGPLTTVDVSTDLNCAVNHSGDAAGEFYGDTACGTLLASGGTLYGPADIPAGDDASPRTAFTPVSQSAVTGSGTGADPFTVVTAVSLGTSPLRITETDSYVTGEESYRTDVTVTNIGDLAASAILYRAGDCFLQNSDAGFGSADTSAGAVSCVVDDGGVPGTRIEQWFPLSAGSHYIEDFYSNVWAAIGTQTPFTDSCNQCANSVDNGAGLSWSLTIPPVDR